MNRLGLILILTIISLGAIVTTIPETSAHPWIDHSPEKVVLAAPGEVVEFEINTNKDVWGGELKGIEITLEYSGTFLHNRARLKEDFPVSLSIYKGYPPFKSVVSVTVPSSTPPGEMYDVQILATATYEDEARGRITLGSVPSMEHLVIDVEGPAEQPPMKVSISCDKLKEPYESGERVVFNVKIEKLIDFEYDESTNTYKGGKYELVTEGPFQLIFTFPGPLETRLFSFDGLKYYSSKDKCFSLAPFAPYREGSYEAKVYIDPTKYGFKKYGESISAVTEFTAIEPEVHPAKGQFEGIKKYFVESKDIPSNAQRVVDHYKKLREKSWNILLSELPEIMSLGPKNNMFFCRIVEPEDGSPPIECGNGFNCVGYVCKTLRFLTKLRFGIGYSDAQRQYLQAIDYGPACVARDEPGEHVAVVLYDYWEKEYWNTKRYDQENIVLDPWPKQSAEFFTQDAFRKKYCLLWAESNFLVEGDPQWSFDEPIYRAFPTVGGAVYWNLEMKDLGIGYPVSPVVGMPGKPSFDQDPYKIKGKITDLSAVTDCPIALEISNDEGKRLGLLENGSMITEIPNSELFIYPNSQTDLTWYVRLPSGKYHVKIRGIADGNLQFLTREGGTLQFYNASIKKNEVATLEFIPNESDEPLTLPNGEKILPKKATIPDLETPSPTTSNQSFTTITSWTTVTDVVTSTQLSTMVVSTTVVTSTATNTLLRDTEKPFTVKAATSGGCQFLPATYNAVAGQRLVGYVTSDKGLNFYLMSKDQFIRYEEAGCGQKVDAYLFIAETTSYALDWVVPQDGTYYFIFENYGSARNQDVKGTFALYDIRLQTTTLTVYSTFSTEIEYTTTRSFSSVYSTPISQPFPIGDNQMGVIALLLLAVPLGLVFAALRRRASKMPRASATRPVAVPPAPTQFCENCGRQISAGTFYCQSCGDKQGV